MTAHPEKIDVRHVFQQMGSQLDSSSGRPPPKAEPVQGSWRVVASDGSIRTFGPRPQRWLRDNCELAVPSEEPNPDEPNLNEPNLNEPNLNEPNLNEPNLNEPNLNEFEPADARSRAAMDSGEPTAVRPAPSLEGLVNQASTSSERNAAMPLASGDCSDLLGATAEANPSPATAQGRGAGDPKPGAVAVVLSSGNRAQGGSDGYSTRPPRFSPKPALPSQVSITCRDVDSQLAKVIDVWPDLPRSVRAAVTALMTATGQDR